MSLTKQDIANALVKKTDSDSNTSISLNKSVF